MAIAAQGIPGGTPSRRKLLALGTGGLLTGAVGVAQLGSATSAAAASTTTPDWVNVTAYGADPTGAIDSAGAFTDALAALGSAGGVIYVPTGTYTVGSEITCTTPAVHFVGDGRWATVISFTGSGDCFRVYDATAYGSRKKYGGGFVGITVDGSKALSGSASCGLHLGDVFQYELDLTVQNFTETGSIGVHLDNAYYWTEQLHGRIYAQQCTSHVVFDNNSVPGTSTSTGSFDRCDLDVYIDQADAAYDGVVLQNGSFILHGSLKIRGNFTSSSHSTSPAQSAVLRLTGNKYGSSGILNSMLDIGVECGGGTLPPPTTIDFGPQIAGSTSNNTISNCYGALNFVAAPNSFSKTNNDGNIFNFVGQTSGDRVLPGPWITATDVFTPTGVTGSVSFRVLPTGQEVMVTWELTVASGVTLTNAEPILSSVSSMANAIFVPPSTKVLPGNLAGGGLTADSYAPAYLTTAGILQYNGPTRTTSAAATWSGQGIYALDV